MPATGWYRCVLAVEWAPPESSNVSDQDMP
jgi:hypothetical protein